ncbi:MAG: glycosyltransferase [Burkholderiales bacterium]
MPTSRLLLTRFNVRIGEFRNPKATEVGWLTNRMNLFKEVTVTSILRQRVQPDRWFVFFDVETPETTRQQLAELTGKVPILSPIFCKRCGPETYLRVVDEYLPASTDWIISTRIDNDDALHPNTLATVYESAEMGRREFINPTRGLVVANGKAYRKRDYSSPFISLSESRTEFATVWQGKHHQLNRHGSIRQIPSRDSWIQVIHGDNIANQVRGVRASPSTIDPDTLPPYLAKQLLDDGLLSLGLDNSIGLAGRYSRSALRRAKRMLIGR